ncbi:MAG: hypothetical protein A3H63_01640 [Candidatus Harrisonbacteria bacterium RIFCSPLOWO2_02_FULL_45_10c]|uniref:Transcriptional regulator n=1 Tax=Candidatus Harrisonbacteria bacterium RIFCSPLOWO2_02_FULL_45_10c TaxID=1798410 RepID=A0A1G1ZTZ9_9BACT|nr:MAG: hypothetical protein A3H63_01640 [Candidatus Harrisonbacteria bacterium RIFCSPLOWO2_02_FULL_45_10c]
MKKNIQQKVLRRLRIAEGQIRGLQRLVKQEVYCIDILRQSSAAKEALSKVEDLLLEHHLEVHAIDQAQRGRGKQAVKEILAVFKLSKRR